MKIRKDILEIIDTPVNRSRIALAFGQGEQSVSIMCRNNADNGPLTKYVALQVIAEISGKGIDEILEEETESEKVNQ